MNQPSEGAAQFIPTQMQRNRRVARAYDLASFGAHPQNGSSELAEGLCDSLHAKRHCVNQVRVLPLPRGRGRAEDLRSLLLP